MVPLVIFKFLFFDRNFLFCKGVMKMEKWEEALKKFVARYTDKDYYEGAIACGSYVSKNNNEYSDIDVHIVLKRGNEWRERGNLNVDGFLIEYFANPVNKYELYCEQEANAYKNHTVAMFANGKIISDKHGEVKKLKEKSIEAVKCEVADLTDFELLSSKYGCWDKFDELKVIYKENRDNFYLAYYKLYELLITLHGKVKKLREFSLTKLDKLLDSKLFRDNYGISKFYDEYDTCLIRDCMVIDAREKMMDKITKFYDYVMEISGGFDINKFVLRSEVK
jgi:hypothetical protein